MKRLSRREFLKLASILPPIVLASRPLGRLQAWGEKAEKQNVLIVVFDAFTAHNVPFYGYPRQTMPNLSRLAERALVYHNHYAGGNFTSPGPASLLTGTYPWTHRAFRFFGKVKRELAQSSLFHAFQGYYRFAYSHNPLVVTLLEQFSDGIEQLIPQSRLMLTNDGVIQSLFKNDEDIATVAWTRTIKREDEFAYSLFLSHLYRQMKERKVKALEGDFPRGVPHYSDNYFLLEDGINWLRDNLTALPRPFCGYFHFYPPHAPYNTHREFYRRFENDGWRPIEKPIETLDNRIRKDTFSFRTQYDEFLLYVDREFGRLFESLEASGLLDNTWVILTSDHGEMFERGICGHLTPVMYQPVVHIPLLIFEPGRTSRADIHTPTSAVDLLPTLLYLTGQPPAEWAKGYILPPFAAAAPRNVYAVQARYNEPRRPLTEATLMMVQGDYKLVRFFGYKKLGAGKERIELYHLREDPEELHNLYPQETTIAQALLQELQEALEKAEAPYR